MPRLLIDKLGHGYHDLFLKIDAKPSSIRIADSFVRPDFLNQMILDTETMTE